MKLNTEVTGKMGENRGKENIQRKVDTVMRDNGLMESTMDMQSKHTKIRTNLKAPFKTEKEMEKEYTYLLMVRI